MKIILQKIKLSKFTHNKKNLGFVPTMGGIHPGHISLIKRSIRECSNTIVSIYVNKQQFNKKKQNSKIWILPYSTTLLEFTMSDSYWNLKQKKLNHF